MNTSLFRSQPRDWLLLAIVLVLVATWCAGWARYSATWSDTRMRAGEPGAPLAVTDGEVALLRLERASTLATADGPISEPGSVYAIATLEVFPTGPEVDCLPHVVFDDASSTSAVFTEFVVRDLPTDCIDLAPNVHQKVELIWAVPEDRIDHIVGVGYPQRLGQMDVLRPAS